MLLSNSPHSLSKLVGDMQRVKADLIAMLMRRRAQMHCYLEKLKHHDLEGLIDRFIETNEDWRHL